MNGVAPDLKLVFSQAVEIESPTDRAAYLDEACGRDSPLRSEVERLLLAAEQAGSFMDGPAVARDDTQLTPNVSERAGTIIGPYKLLQQIGEGGMGIVFMAEQSEPIQRTVALKIIKPGMDSRQVIARFEAERQALAMMDHPNIARVIDAGTTDTGRPYFVMDLVKGAPITRYCDENNLSLRERLELFLPVCQAVQHAHQKGIIHRDIKPNNVLVAEYDNHAVPKVIDFGVAKATAQKLTERTMFTEFGQLIGTFEYMSPEQARFNQLDVDTRSDIYSLGVLLYELLSGSTPVEKERLRSAAFDEILRIISEEEPPRPSTRLSSSQALPRISAQRQSEPAKLTKMIRGELDWIVMKCLEKDRNRRYESANDLAADIWRYLDDEPVLACPPSAYYRFGKFARRHKVALAFFTLLTTGFVFFAFSYVAIKRERDAKAAALAQANTEGARAKTVSDLLQEMLGSADPDQAKGISYTARELLDDFSAGLAGQLADQPEVEADIRTTIGRAYRSLGVPDQAVRHLVRAIELRRKIYGADHEKVASDLVDYAWSLRDQGRHAEAEPAIREALEIYHKRGVTDAKLMHALRIFHQVLISSRRFEDAESVNREAISVAERNPKEALFLPDALAWYASLRIWQGRYAEAEQFARQTLDMHRRLYGKQHLRTAWVLNTLATALQSQQKLDEAESAYRETLAIFQQHYSYNDNRVIFLWDKLKRVLQARGDRVALAELASIELDQALNSDHATYHLHLAKLLMTTDSPSPARTEEAHRLIHRAMQQYDRAAIDSPGNYKRGLKTAEGYVEVVGTCVADPEFAQDVHEARDKLIVQLRELLTKFPTTECQWKVNRLWAMGAQRDPAYLLKAEQLYRETIEVLERKTLTSPNLLETHLSLAHANCLLAFFLRRSNRPEDAEAAYRRGIEICDQRTAEFAADPACQADYAISCIRFGHFLAITKRREEATDYYRKGIDILPDDAGSNGEFQNEAASYLVLMPATNHRDTEAAVRLAQRALQLDPTNGKHWATLGAARYRADDWRGALDAINKSIVLGQGGDAMNWFFLAMTHHQLGQKQEAKKWYEKAIDWVHKNDPSNEELLRCNAEAAQLLDIREPNSDSASVKPIETPANADDSTIKSSPY